ncbi:4241_t:CDS:10 [Ambispora gerdemannii]|uniref:Large ribosomal subunit protein bL28m n=1 Tax=Ambispora gerdemannii TaxID=144530 RepID=A0A9N8Z6X9_9GLOM|nr:4241_t:CDS:10 [Ambispora gerdemannii]
MASSNRSLEHGNSREPSLVGNYVVGIEIGRGSFATVYKGCHKRTKQSVAIKSVLRSKLTGKLLENLESEIAILKGIRHIHIVQLVDCQNSDAHIHLIMEYCSMGDLSNYIKRRGDMNSTNAVAPSSGGLSEYVVLHFLKQLANALEFLRSQNLIHRDIKPQNLLLLPPSNDKEILSSYGSPDLPLLKIADFGFARILPSTSLAETLCGSPLYMAPEILRYEKYDAKADLWSVGAVLYEMSVGKPPFRAQNHVELLRKIEKNGDRIKFPGDIVQQNIGGNTRLKDDHHPEGQTIISDDLKDLIRQLLKRNPVERISFEEFFMHPCVAGELQLLNPPSSSSSSSTTSKQKLSSYEYKNRPKSYVRPNHDIENNNYNNHNQHNTRDRSKSSPAVPLHKDVDIGINNYQSRGHHVHKTRNKDIEGASPKGIIALTTTGLDVQQNPAVLQKKTSKDRIKHQTYQRTTRYPPKIGHLGNEKFESSRTNDNEPQLNSHPSDANSPSASLLIQNSDKNVETSKKRVDVDVRRLSRAEDDVLLEREYVVVEEKGTIEVNVLADEIVISPKLNEIVIKDTAKNTDNQASDNKSPEVQFRTNVPLQNPSAAYFYSTTPPFALPVNHERGSSSGSNGSASSALARALSMASVRLFGNGGSPPSWSDRYSKAKGNPIGTSSDAISDSEEETVVKIIEDAARKAYVVYQFADSKYYQLLPPPPSSNDLVDTSPLTAEAAIALAEEALVLYVKALSLLKAAMDSAKQYWAGIGHRKADYPGMKVASHKLNNAVQWVRSRYNECLEKAEYVKSKCQTEDERGVGAVPEKLLYDRALEMSRQAALDELENVDLLGCERAYQTAILMLQAILDNPQDEQDSMDEDDRRIQAFPQLFFVMRATLVLLARNLKHLTFKRAQKGLFHGKRIQFGNQVSEHKNKSPRTWLPNVRVGRLWSETFKRWTKIKVTTAALRTIDKKGGLDRYLLTTEDELLGARGVKMRGYLETRLAWIQKQKYPNLEQIIGRKMYERPPKPIQYKEGEDPAEWDDNRKLLEKFRRKMRSKKKHNLVKESNEPKLSKYAYTKILEAEGDPTNTFIKPLKVYQEASAVAIATKLYLEAQEKGQKALKHKKNEESILKSEFINKPSSSEIVNESTKLQSKKHLEKSNNNN